VCGRRRAATGKDAPAKATRCLPQQAASTMVSPLPGTQAPHHRRQRPISDIGGRDRNIAIGIGPPHGKAAARRGGDCRAPNITSPPRISSRGHRNHGRPDPPPKQVSNSLAGTDGPSLPREGVKPCGGAALDQIIAIGLIRGTNHVRSAEAVSRSASAEMVRIARGQRDHVGGAQFRR